MSSKINQITNNITDELIDLVNSPDVSTQMWTILSKAGAASNLVVGRTMGDQLLKLIEAQNKHTRKYNFIMLEFQRTWHRDGSYEESPFIESTFLMKNGVYATDPDETQVLPPAAVQQDDYDADTAQFITWIDENAGDVFDALEISKHPVETSSEITLCIDMKNLDSHRDIQISGLDAYRIAAPIPYKLNLSTLTQSLPEDIEKSATPRG